MSDNPQKVTILFTGGGTITLVVDELTVDKSSISNDLRGIHWANARPHPMYLRLEDVQAVIYEDSESA